MKRKVLIILFLVFLIGVTNMTGINHEAVKAHGDKGTAVEWNADHKITGNVDCEQHQHLNHVLENRTDYPAGPVPGQIIFRSDFPNALVWTGTMWASLTPVATIVVAADGTGNYTDIQDGIDALPAGGGVVYIKEGTYVITATITITKSYVSIIGAGSCTKIQTFSNIDMLEVGNFEGIHLNKLYFYGDTTKANNRGIFLNGSNGTTIRDVRIDKCGSHGIYADTGTYNLISGCLIYTNEGNGIEISNGGVYTIAESQVSSNKGSGIYVNSAPQIDISDVEISFNENYGVYIANSNTAVIKGNVMAVNNWDGIRINTQDDVLINSNTIYLTGFANGGAGNGVFLVTADDCQISNNLIYLNSGWGINISNAASDNNIVLGNRLRTNTAGGLNDAGTGTDANHNLVT